MKIKKKLLITISILLLISGSCTREVYNTKISKKEQEKGVYNKQIISINGHSYLKTDQRYSKIQVISYADRNQKISFDTYAGSLKTSIEDINQDGQKDLVVTSRPYLSNYWNTEVLIADKEGKLVLKKNHCLIGYYPLEGKEFYYIVHLKSSETPKIKQFVHCKWTNSGFDEIQFCYFDKESKESLCFSKKLKGAPTLHNIEQERKNATVITIDTKFEEWLFSGDY